MDLEHEGTVNSVYMAIGNIHAPEKGVEMAVVNCVSYKKGMERGDCLQFTKQQLISGLRFSGEKGIEL